VLILFWLVSRLAGQPVAGSPGTLIIDLTQLIFNQNFQLELSLAKLHGKEYTEMYKLEICIVILGHSDKPDWPTLVKLFLIHLYCDALMIIWVFSIPLYAV
jgi:hypothetical protein